MTRTLLEQLIARYPAFYDFEDTTNNYKFAALVAFFLKDVDTQKLKIELAMDIERPLQLHRDQITDYGYIMAYSVHIPNIKQVKLYNGADVLLVDSGELELGTNIYTGDYSATSGDIIPTTQYYLEVTDWHDHVLYKGFPENETIVGDKYDKDQDLDIIGKFFGIPRRTYDNSALVPADYPNTTPTYCIDGLEWDYIYQERIKELMLNPDNKSLAELEFYRIFAIYPTIENRSHSLCIMGTGNPADTYPGSKMYSDAQSPNEAEAKYMLTQEWLETSDWWGVWNPCAYDITAVLEDIPPNIENPSANDVESILNRTLGISKLAFCTFRTADVAATDGFILYDKVNFGFEVGREAIILKDSYTASVTGGYDPPDSILLNDEYLVVVEKQFISSKGSININAEMMYYTPVGLTEDGRLIYGNIQTGKMIDERGYDVFA